MSNQRAKDQVLIAFALRRQLREGLDQARQKTKQDRSAFIRQAMAREIRRAGVYLEPGIEDAPDRAGKQGHDECPQVLQSKTGLPPSSTSLGLPSDVAGASVLKAAVPKSGQKTPTDVPTGAVSARASAGRKRPGDRRRPPALAPK